jgi:hypothetical protein
MVSLGIARLVAFVLLVVLVFGSSLHQQEGAGESYTYICCKAAAAATSLVFSRFIFRLNLHYCSVSDDRVLKAPFHFPASEGATRLHERRQQHAQQWAEERNQLRSYMTMDYAPWRRRVPKHN